ncbi:MAG: two-component regulator propeller domain-containing protein [Bacteroidia bacterium]
MRCSGSLFQLITGLLLCFGSQAQDNGFFDQVWLDEGLSQSSVMSVCQDKQGFMWFGTQDGLNRYDGKTVDKINSRPFDPTSITGNSINGICSDQEGQIWVANSNALDLLDIYSLKAAHISQTMKVEDESQRRVINVWTVKEKVYFFSFGGLCELNKKNGNYEAHKIEILRDKETRLTVFSVCADGKGNLYLSSSQGIFIKSSGNKSFEAFSFNEELFNKPARTVLIDKQKLYLSQENRMYFIDLDKKSLFSYTPAEGSMSLINSALIDSKGKLWISTVGEGLFQLSFANSPGGFQQRRFIDKQRKYGLNCSALTCLFQGQQNNEDVVWIGSRDAGVFSYSYAKNSFSLVSSLVEKNKIFYAILKDKDSVVWVGAQNGIYRIDRLLRQSDFVDMTEITLKSGRPIEALHIDRAGKIWVGSGNSLYVVDKKKLSVSKVIDQLSNDKRNGVFRIIPASNGELLIGTEMGLVKYDPVNKSKENITTVDIDGKPYKIPSVGALFCDSKGNWWIGSTMGLIMANRSGKGNKLYTYDPKDTTSLLSDWVMDIQEGRNGQIVIATTKGLALLKDKEKGTFENYSTAKGLTNNFIYGLLPDQADNFWMCTNYGIAVFDPVQKKFRSYHGSDGIAFNEFNSGGFHKGYDGEMLFGGIGGLVAFYPERMVKSMLPPKLVMRSFNINQVSADSLVRQRIQKVKLGYKENNLRFDFSVPDFSGGARTTILWYRLKGVQTRWQELSDYSLALANLGPGNYFLEVKAVNAEGVESPQPFSFAFSITPPFWLNVWFYVIVVLGILLISWFVYRMRLQRKIALLKQLEKVRQEENEKVRKAAALDLHDEFGNGLTRISMLVEMAKIKLPRENEESIKLLGIISENSLRLYQGTKDFIWSINPGNDNLYEIMIRIKDFGDELFYGTGAGFEIIGLNDDFKDIRQLPGTGRNIAMIFKEALSNCVKHAKADKVRLTIERKDGKIKMCLQDNGKGFDPGINKNGFGISNMKQRASRIGAEISVHSETGKGTEIVLIF